MNTYLTIMLVVLFELAMCLGTIAFSLFLEKLVTGKQTPLFMGNNDGQNA